MPDEVTSTGIGDINEAVSGGVVLIQSTNGEGQSEYAGTGFLFKNGPMTFLVTALHVFDRGEGERLNRVSIRLRSSLRYPFEGRDVELPLWDGERARFRRFGDIPIDVAVLRLSDAETEGRYPFAFTPEHIVPDNIYLPVGSDVVLPGYPEGQYDVQNYLPLVRRGALASVYGIPYNSEQHFQVDAHVRVGMSGAPVLTKPDSWLYLHGEMPRFVGTPISFLVGVHSQGIDPIGIHNAWYARAILGLTIPLDVEAIGEAFRAGGLEAARSAFEASAGRFPPPSGERPTIRFRR